MFHCGGGGMLPAGQSRREAFHRWKSGRRRLNDSEEVEGVCTSVFV